MPASESAGRAYSAVRGIGLELSSLLRGARYAAIRPSAPGQPPYSRTVGLEDRGLAFLHVEPVLAESIDDVGFVRDDHDVGAAWRHLACELAESGGASVVFVGGDYEAALRQVDALVHLVEARQLGRLIGPVEAARVDLGDRNTNCLEGGPERLCRFLALGVQLALLRHVVVVERISIGLVSVGGTVERPAVGHHA